MGAVFALYSAWYFWIPKILGVDYNKSGAKAHFWILFVGVNVTFFPQHFLGLQGMPRRISDYPDAFAGWNLVSSLGSIISVIATWLFLYILYVQLVEGKSTSNYPWLTPQFYYDLLQTHLTRSFNSLEWGLNSPPKPHAFVSLPLQSFLIKQLINILCDFFDKSYYTIIAIWANKYNILGKIWKNKYFISVHLIFIFCHRLLLNVFFTELEIPYFLCVFISGLLYGIIWLYYTCYFTAYEFNTRGFMYKVLTGILIVIILSFFSFTFVITLFGLQGIWASIYPEHNTLYCMPFKCCELCAQDGRETSLLSGKECPFRDWHKSNVPVPEHLNAVGSMSSEWKAHRDSRSTPVTVMDRARTTAIGTHTTTSTATGTDTTSTATGTDTTSAATGTDTTSTATDTTTSTSTSTAAGRGRGTSGGRGWGRGTSGGTGWGRGTSGGTGWGRGTGTSGGRGAGTSGGTGKGVDSSWWRK